MDYSVLIIGFWGLLAILVCYEWCLFQRDRVLANAKVFYWIFAFGMVAFAAFRPLGIARDDIPYMGFYNEICPINECGKWIQSTRDWGWYALVGVLKSGFDDVRIMLWLGAAALIIKLLVLFSIAKRPLPVLLLYTSVFYEVQDLTAWRVSLSLSVFLAAIWLLVHGKTYLGGVLAVVCGIFHKQGFAAPLVLLGRFFCRRQTLLAYICLALLGLVFLGFVPDFQIIVSSLGDFSQTAFVKNGLDSYVSAMLAGAYHGNKNAPVVVYPFALLILWLLLKSREVRPCFISVMSGCLFMGCFFLWIFASITDAQVRFFEFFMVPTVLLAGVRQLRLVEFAALVVVSGIFVAKYNILHPLITGGI